MKAELFRKARTYFCSIMLEFHGFANIQTNVEVPERKLTANNETQTFCELP